jgi:hypothetical protein
MNVEEIELFASLSSQENDVPWDIHNNYEVVRLSFSGTVFELFLQSNDLTQANGLVIKFEDARIQKMSQEWPLEGGLTIDNLYRGRFEYNGALLEVTGDGLGYFYIDFVENLSIELFARKISFEAS